MKIPRILSRRIKEKYDISRNTFISKDKGKKAEEREVEIGDIHSDIFQPQVKLKQWENETNFSVRLIDDEPIRPRIRTIGNKIKFLKNKVEAHFYETKIDKKTDAFEFEILLKEKPKTNKVKMSIRTKGLKFYYQPPLNEEKHEPEVVKCTPTDCYDKDGNVICHRPENVVGSYAVYHESKAGDYSKMGKKNYRCGKAFHIYRPKIIDSKGNWVWGKLNINEKKELLTVEISQEFLDKAVYPVIVDPTFGQTSEGSSSRYGPDDNELRGTAFTSPADAGQAVNITGFLGGYVETINWKGIIALTSTKEIITNGVADPGSNGNNYNENSSVFSTQPTISPETSYILAAIFDTSYRIAYDSVEEYVGYDETNNYNSPQTITASPTHDKYSIYCTYTAGATEKEVTDVGSGADAVSVKCQTPITDSGAGADIATILASMNLTDTGSGTDTISITQLKSLLETGNGADIVSLINKLSITDSGLASEVINILFQIALQDSGTGTEVWKIDRGFEKITVDKGTVKAIDDSGAGLESLKILSKIALTDTGQGQEALAVLSKIAITDTCVGTEAINILVRIALTDSGAGSEALDILYKIAITDTGAGSEIINILSRIAIQETGTGTDTVDKQIQGDSKQVSDTGSGSEALSVLAQIAMTDSGVGTEAITALVSLAVLDSGVGNEIINILSQILQTDSGSGTEALEILRKIAVSDSGVGTDAIALLIQTALSDTGNGVEAVEILTQLSVTDSGTGSEIINILNQTVLSDTGQGSEALDILRQIAITDTGTGSEALTVLVQLAVAETGSGADSVSVGGNVKQITDSGTGNEALNILVGMSITDSGIGSEVLDILNQIALSDTANGADAITVIGQFALSDSGSGSEALEVLSKIAVSDSGVATEALEVLVKVAMTDSGTGIEILNILNQIAISDSGTGADEIEKTVLDTREISDSGAGTDTVAFSKQLVLQDSGVGVDSVFKQNVIAAIATILSTLDKNADIKFTGQVKATIKKIINN